MTASRRPVTQEKVAEHPGKPQPFVSKAETGERRIERAEPPLEDQPDAWVRAADLAALPPPRGAVLGAETRAEAIRSALEEAVRRRRLAQALRQRGQFQLRGDLSELRRLREEG
jgi:hypothetical protein